MNYEVNKTYTMTVLFADAKGRYVNVQSPEKQVFKIDIEGQLAQAPKTLSGRRVDVVCTGDAINFPPNFMLAEKYFSNSLKLKHKTRGKCLGLLEGLKVEFKKSIIYSSTPNQPGANKLYEIAREIAAFMNTDGGELYCGVDDEGYVVGVENDLPVLASVAITGINGKTDKDWSYKPTHDGFSQKLRNVVRFYLGDFASTLMGDPEFLTDETTGVVYVKIVIKPSLDEFVYLGVHENVYYRTGTSAVLLEGRSRERYARFRFKNFTQTEHALDGVAQDGRPNASRSICEERPDDLTVVGIADQQAIGKLIHYNLPDWADKLIFEDLGAVYCRENCNMTVIDWSWDQIKKYLGTYFPRSYAESYCIFSEYFKAHQDDYIGKSQLSIYDFGCGTGGGTMGLIAAIEDQLPAVSEIHVKGLDGNKYALRMFELVFNQQPNRRKIGFKFDVVPVKIDDIYDLSVVTDVMSDRYDFVITFKAICELVSKQQFEERNPYGHVVHSFLPKLKYGGLMCLVDVTTKIGNEWIPHLIDKGIGEEGVEVISRNAGYNESFYVTHSHAQNDLSKIAWRIIKAKQK